MQKIVIRNFGPIREADIDLRKIVLLIGEQAGGKSTIAKLIYFFKVLGDRVFERYYKAEDERFQILDYIIIPAREEFYALFGSTKHLPEFEVMFYYHWENEDSNQRNYIQLVLGPHKELVVRLSDSFISPALYNDLITSKRRILSIQNESRSADSAREDLVLTEEKLKAIQHLSGVVDAIFHNNQNSQHYIVAGRESTVSYQSTFKNYLDKRLEEEIESNRKKKSDFQVQTVDEVLMLKFLDETRRVVSVIDKLGGNFENAIANWEIQQDERDQSFSIASLLLERERRILKGRYEIDRLGEKIRLLPDSYVNLKDASSGQKESIRILQHMLISILENQKFFTVIEEPEAHLFPMAQKSLVELLVLMVNQQPESQLLITTHSPYILTVFNNLLFASRVATRNPEAEAEVCQVAEKEFWIDPALFSAYSLGNSFLPDSSHCESIFNEKTGVIKQNYLDIISEMLGSDFNQLYQLHAQSFSQPGV